MEVEAVPAPRALEAHVRSAPPPPRRWACAVVAQLLAGLVQRPVTAEEVQRRAVGLGLSRHPCHELCLMSIARLFLSAYRLPAHIEEGTLSILESHLAAGRRCWVVLHDDAYLVLGLSQQPFGEMRVTVRPAGDRFVVEQLLPVDELVEAWKVAGCPLVSAADWSDLPRTGEVFFGGLRDRDGSYHWVTAECDTDGDGRILRY